MKGSGASLLVGFRATLGVLTTVHGEGGPLWT